MSMLTVSQFMQKKLDERVQALAAAENQRRAEVRRAFQNIAMIFLNSELWEDVRMYPNMIYLVVDDEALELFRYSMEVLGKELLSFDRGTIYENGTTKNVISIECTYTDKTIDDMFDTIVQNLCERAGCEREEIIKIAEKHNRVKDWT